MSLLILIAVIVGFGTTCMMLNQFLVYQSRALIQLELIAERLELQHLEASHRASIDRLQRQAEKEFNERNPLPTRS